MKKVTYFCDLCTRETRENEIETVRIPISSSGNTVIGLKILCVTKDVCHICIKERIPLFREILKTERNDNE